MIEKIVFWGNINIHVYPLARALSKITNVTIIYDSSVFTNRTERRIIYTPSSTLHLLDISKEKISVKDLASQLVSEGTVHINTALKADNSFNHKALVLLNRMGGEIYSLPQEGFQFNGFKAIVNYLKWFFYINFKYRSVRGFGLTGNNAFLDFKLIHCNQTRLFPFIYVTEPFDIFSYEECGSIYDIVQIVFVGAIDDRKNIKRIVSILNKNRIEKEYVLHIYGGYGDIDALKRAIGSNHSIMYHGIVSNKEIRKAMSTADIIILPSIYDGWGAVINEALQCGCRALVSNKCGSSAMISRYPYLGEVFDPYNESDFMKKFSALLKKGKLDYSERSRIIEWSKTHIHPDVAADYLIKVFEALRKGDSLPNNLFY